MATHSSILSWRIPVDKIYSPWGYMGYSPWDRKELDTTERLSTTHACIPASSPPCFSFRIVPWSWDLSRY